MAAIARAKGSGPKWPADAKLRGDAIRRAAIFLPDRFGTTRHANDEYRG